MFKLISIQQVADATPENSDGRAIRCLILADNTTDTLPTIGSDVDGMGDDQEFLPGSICVAPDFSVCVMQNNGTWGEWK